MKIVDFGYSKFVRPTDALKDACGTVKYWAPELVNGAATRRSTFGRSG